MAGRDELRLQALLLKTQGLDGAAIARALGVSKTTVYRWLDPEVYAKDLAKSRAYKRSVTGVCEDCGGVTHYNGVRTKGASAVCSACMHQRQAAERIWTREAIIVAMQAWASRHGHPPTANEWNKAAKDRSHPNARTVYCQPKAPFGSWADAVEAAGFPRPQQGHYERTPLTAARWRATRARNRVSA